MSDAPAPEQDKSIVAITQRNHALLEASIMAIDPATKHKVIAIHPSLSAKYNVLAPAALIMQEGSFFEPAVHIVVLDPREESGDFYPLQGKLAPAKPALQKLGDAAGIQWDGGKSHGKEGAPVVVELPTGNSVTVTSYTYHAVGYIRRADGTLKELTADEEWQPNIALLEIKTASSKPNAAAVEKQFIFAARKRAQMIRSKAMNGVLRQALPGVKQVYTTDELTKPFLVISHQWAPDASDPATERIVAALVGVDTATLYGSPESAPALAAAPADVIPFEPDADDVVDGETVEMPADEQPPEFEAPADEEAIEGEVVDETPADSNPHDLSVAEVERYVELGQWVVPLSNHTGHTLDEIATQDPGWFAQVIKWGEDERASRLAARAKPLSPTQAAVIDNAVEYRALALKAGDSL